jgi:hypothetical protein
MSQIHLLLPLLIVLLAPASVPIADDTPVVALPPGYKPLHDIIDLAHYIPGMGEIYIVPEEMNQKPWLNVDRNGRIVGATFVQAEPQGDEWAREQLQSILPGMKVNHVDRQSAFPHPGQQTHHYHTTYWFISHEEHMIYLR